ncbi:hypothetical protein CAL65_08925 [Alkalilimnicola ehrlichii]|uniref:Uncharacterized protein n=1 Tax=Alkalilimnicola ehrlichii TaxID=351052 RepID=A0A3E0WWM8_9GAMM|nr:hypothetical protein CAL65_08925 [Alkalilimnicola ehrlichii]
MYGAGARQDRECVVAPALRVAPLGCNFNASHNPIDPRLQLARDLLALNNQPIAGFLAATAIKTLLFDTHFEGLANPRARDPALGQRYRLRRARSGSARPDNPRPYRKPNPAPPAQHDGHSRIE